MQIDITKLISGDRRTLGKAITLIESTRDEDKQASQELLKKILPYTGKSFRVGITGVPGVGKSTFIESFGQYTIKKGHKMAVLAIDPSSPISGGSILGDKTRMEKLSQEENAFIRPSPSSGFLGGVAQKTRETILLCEAAGYDYIVVETVGVGQSEFEVSDMVDFFMILMLPNAGDELQGIKKGILELADAIIINKADGEALNHAKQSLAQYQSAMELFRHTPHWNTQSLMCSALHGQNIDAIYKMITEFKDIVGDEFISNHRLTQNKDWYLKLIQEILNLKITKNEKLTRKKIDLEKEVLSGNKLALTAANEFVEMLLPN
jgi:LAO/AO transport system kinase